MAEFWRRPIAGVRRKRPIRDPLESVLGGPEVRYAGIAVTTVESLGDSSTQAWQIAGVLSNHLREANNEPFARTLSNIVSEPNNGLGWTFHGLYDLGEDSVLGRYHLHAIQNVTIPNNVRELRSRCFARCLRLRCVTFGSSSLLERIGASCFKRSEIEEINIPDSVRELCDKCFKDCFMLRRVTFGSSSSLERIGTSCFHMSEIEEMSIPDSVRELCEDCFMVCPKLWRVTFGSSSSLEKIGKHCFVGCALIEFEIPCKVESLGCGAFFECPLSGGIICRGCSRFCAFGSLVLSRDCERCFSGYGILSSVCIPDGVRELCDGCFKWCASLRRVTFGCLSSLEWIGSGCFEYTGVEELSIPDSVRALGGNCFKACSSLRRVTFGYSSSLERIGAEAFGAWVGIEGNLYAPCGVVEISIPDGVVELCNGFFKGCESLSRVAFGSLSSLERIGARWLHGTIVTEVSIPDGVRELCDSCFNECINLRHVTFGSSSSLELIGIRCFEMSEVTEVSIPDGVRELCDLCFEGCKSLSRVTFGSSSSLERIGAEAFGAWVGIEGNLYAP